MATNPRVPDRRPLPTLAEQKKVKSGSPLVPLGILAAAILLLAILYFMPRTPKAGMAPTNAAVPVQPSNGQIQFSAIRISEAPTGGQMYIYANMVNTGNTEVNGVRARVIFQDQNGQALQSVDGVVEAVDQGAGVNLVDRPIKPSQSEAVRIPVTQVPQGWNHKVPSIEIADVTSVGAK
jgi:hypothetical protein